MHPRLLAAVAFAGALASSGCGSSASTTDASVIRDWAQALRSGNIAKAASYFALPAVVADGTAPVRIDTPAQARDFNRLLPCGAQLVSTMRHGPYTFATFKLTDRVGGGCGSGTGTLVATAFLIRDGKIVRWLRLPNPGSGQPPPGTTTQAPV